MAQSITIVNGARSTEVLHIGRVGPTRPTQVMWIKVTVVRQVSTDRARGGAGGPGGSGGGGETRPW